MHRMFTIYSNHQDGNSVHKHESIKFEGGRGRETTRYKVCIYPNQLYGLIRLQKLHHLKSQPIFSEVSKMEWLDPFNFPTGTSGFPK